MVYIVSYLIHTIKGGITMKHKSILSSFLFGLMLSACVTINIYFPAAAAEDAARVIVRDVLNEETSRSQLMRVMTKVVLTR